MPRPEIVIVHDYLTQRGGAERVVLSILKMYPDAPLFTAVYNPDGTYPEFADYDVRPLWTNRVRALRRDHRRGLLIYPLAFSALKVDADVVLCSSSGFAHGARTTGRKVVYCYSPPRWLYDEAHTYLAGWPSPVAGLVRAARPVLRRWDRRAASTADSYLTSTNAVRERIGQAYGIAAEIVAPPVHSLASEVQCPVAGIDPGFALCVSRLLAYKNVKAVSSAFDRLPTSRLVVVGTGPEQSGLMAAAGPNVRFVGQVNDAELAWLYANCAGVIAAGHEDFGLAPVEGACFGKPVAALRSGGFLDTVVEGTTGVFFDVATPQRIALAVQHLLQHPWDADRIAEHSQQFVQSCFARRVGDAIRRQSPAATTAGA